MSELGSAFGELVRDARARLDIGRARLGELLGVSRQTIGFWESGAVQPPESRWEQIERALQLDPGSVRASLSTPLTGGSLDYWVGRWEQATTHLERVLQEQRDLVSFMKQKASERSFAYPQQSGQGIMKVADSPPVPFLSSEEIDSDVAAVEDLEAKVSRATAEREAQKQRKADG